MEQRAWWQRYNRYLASAEWQRVRTRDFDNAARRGPF
jgi:hypothetical protein